jgi:hypothetical protein
MWDNQYDDEPQLVSEWGIHPTERELEEIYNETHAISEAIVYLKEYITGFPDLDIRKISLQFTFDDGFELVLQPWKDS